MRYVRYNPNKQKFDNLVVGFKQDLLEHFPKIIADELNMFSRDIAKYALRRLVELTPTDTRDTRGRWKVSLNAPTQDDSFSSSVITDGIAIINQSKPGDIFYIQNNSVVAQILEYGLFEPADPGPSKDPRKERFGKILVRHGYSTQAPSGMATIVEAEIAELYK